ncbi:MFS transporter [Actinosynnema pretiosum subsp. pretiosum]|uniref:MFS transporter n=1 Tax=Actinosynnema pretiosum subsp. pretiosum TaxID=103721 RepID=A0AA45LCU3_9PSEU|nr:Tetracycline resistance protein [Actinosynnema pretiosum subsp. pretiosum]QUF06940.1 MFS transporter [Actinosynnema pretiosum subsp. pretiosum]
MVIAAEPVQRRVLKVLAVSQVLGSSGIATGLALSALVAVSLSGVEAVGGFAQTCAVVGAAVSALPAARLAQRAGRRPVLVLCYGVGAVGALLAAVAVVLGSWQLLLPSLVLFGAAGSANLAARYAGADLAAPHERARSLALVVWAATVGAVVGPNLAAPTGRAVAGLGLPEGSGAYLTSAVLFGAAALVVLRFLRPDPLVLARGSAAEPVETGPRGRVWRSLPSSGRLAVVGIAVSHGVMVGLMAMAPVHVGHAGGSLSLVGVLVSLHVAGMYGLSPLVGWLVDRWGGGAVQALGAALLVAAAALVGSAAGDDPVRLGIGLVLLGLGWSAGVIAGSALLTEVVAGSRRTAAQGLSDLCMNCAGALGGVLAGLVVTAWSYAALGLLAGFVVLPMLVVAVLRVR